MQSFFIFCIYSSWLTKEDYFLFAFFLFLSQPFFYLHRLTHTRVPLFIHTVADYTLTYIAHINLITDVYTFFFSGTFFFVNYVFSGCTLSHTHKQVNRRRGLMLFRGTVFSFLSSFLNSLKCAYYQTKGRNQNFPFFFSFSFSWRGTADTELYRHERRRENKTGDKEL